MSGNCDPRCLTGIVLQSRQRLYAFCSFSVLQVWGSEPDWYPSKNACYLPVNAPLDKLIENPMCAALTMGVLAERNAVLS
jgi:hypothetical protein